MRETGGSANKDDMPDNMMDRQQLLENAHKNQSFIGHSHQGQNISEAEQYRKNMERIESISIVSN